MNQFIQHEEKFMAQFCLKRFIEADPAAIKALLMGFATLHAPLVDYQNEKDSDPFTLFPPLVLLLVLVLVLVEVERAPISIYWQTRET